MAGKQTIWSLALEISGKGTEASQAIRTVKKQLEDLKAAAGQLGKDWKAFTGNASKLALGAAGGVAAATAGVVSMANSFAAAGDKVLKASQATGIGIEAYQELQYALGKSGVSAESFDAALQKFNLTVRNGAAGNEALQKQLLAVGLSAEKLAEIKPEQAMMRLSDYMKQLPNDAERTRVAVQLFEKSAGPEMMAALKQGSDAIAGLREESKSATFTFSRDHAEISRQFQNTKKGLAGAFENVKFSFIAGSMGPITDALKTLQETVLSSVPSISELGEKFGTWLGGAVKRLPEIITKIKEFGTWVKNTVTGVKNFVGGWKNLAKILAGLAVAPTLISGLKTVFSFGKLIHTAMKSLPLIMAKMGLAAVPIGSALLPIIGIIAGIAAVIYTVVKNFDTLKQYALDCFKRIAQAFSGGARGITVDWKKIKEDAMTVLAFIEKTVLVVIKTAMNAITSAIQIAVGAFKVLWGIVQTGWVIFETGIKIISALFRGDLSGVIKAVSSLFIRFSIIGQEMFNGLWAVTAGFGDFFKNFFGDIFEFVKNIFGLFGIDVAGIFNDIKSSITGVTDWFKDGFTSAVNFVTGLWENIKGAFTGIGAWFGEKFNAAKEAIKGAFIGVIDWVKNNWKSIALFIINPFAGVFKYLYDNFEGFRNAVNNVVSAVKGFFERGIDFIKNIINSLPEPFQNIFAAVKTRVDSFVGFWKNVFASAVAAIKNIAGFLPGIFEDPIGTIKAVFGEFAGFWKNVFQGAVDAVRTIAGALGGIFGGIFNNIKAVIETVANVLKNVFQGPIEIVKGIIEGLTGIFTGVFDAIKSKITGFTDFFTSKFEGIKNFFGGLGHVIGGVFGARDNAMPGHASGGIFTQPHIAQIAEKGAEAVVPLNKSPQAFGIWKQAGELGGYLKTASGQAPAISAAASVPASVPAAAPPLKTPEPSPVAAAAAQRMSAGNNIVNVNFTQKNTFNGAAPDRETVNQISAAGRQAADDFETRVKAALESIQRNQLRRSYA
jgi:phage-related protein